MNNAFTDLYYNNKGQLDKMVENNRYRKTNVSYNIFINQVSMTFFFSFFRLDGHRLVGLNYESSTLLHAGTRLTC